MDGLWEVKDDIMNAEQNGDRTSETDAVGITNSPMNESVDVEDAAHDNTIDMEAIEQIDDLDSAKKMLQSIHQEYLQAKHQVKQLKLEMRKQRQDHEEMEEKLIAMEKENAILAEENDDLIMRAARASTESTVAGTHTKALLIADGNGESLIDDLVKQKDMVWTIRSNTDTIDTASDYIEKNQQEIKKQDVVCLLLGSMHIQRDETAKAIWDKMIKLLEQIRNKPTLICEIPPFKDNRTHNNETKIFNTILQTNKDKLPKNSTICTYRDKISSIPISKLMTDDLHLRSGEGTQSITAIIRETALTAVQQIKPGKAENRKPEVARGAEVSRTVYVPADMAGLVIGKQGLNLKNWHSKYKVRIEKNEDRQRPMFTVAGEEAEVNRTVAEMRAIYNEGGMKDDRRRERDRRVPAPKSNAITCRYYQMGTCRNGTRCKFEHGGGGRAGGNADRSRSPRRRAVSPLLERLGTLARSRNVAGYNATANWENY